MALGLGCQGPVPPERTHFDDLLLDETLWDDRDSPPQAQFCGDETHFAVELFDGDEITLEIPLSDSPQLTLGGCVGRPKRSFGPAEATLEIQVDSLPGNPESAETLPIREKIFVERAQAWFSKTYDLEALAGGTAKLRLRLQLPDERYFYLRDLHISEKRTGPPIVPAPGPKAKLASSVPQILLISIDTLRSDALGAYGSTNATPNLDRLAAESQTFLTHYASATWTKPSHASLLTGHPPSVGRGMDRSLDPLVSTIAERLQAEGLATAGLVHDCVWLNPKFGFDRGFDEYQSVRWQLPKQIRQVANWIGDHRDQPFFFFSHNFEVHSDFNRLPYEAPGINIITVKRLFGHERYGCRDARCGSRRLSAINDGEAELLPGEEKTLRYLYDRSVEFMDQQLGLLFDELRAQGSWDNLMVVVTSDHGESFGEHGELLHKSPWEQVLRVPLIIKWPGGRFAGERRDQPTSALDVVPTLLEAYGFDTSGTIGTPLLERRRDLPVFAGTVEPVVIREHLKAMFGLDHRYRLFDLAADPQELEDLSGERPDDLESLKALLKGFRRTYDRQRKEAGALFEQGESGNLTDEDRERLKSLGYLGGT